MTRPATPLRIAPQPDQTSLSKGQKTFNALVKKIESSRQLLAQWQDVMLAVQQRVASHYSPLLQTLRETEAALVRALDRALDRKGLSKAERRVVAQVICRLAEQLVVDTGDETIKAIYNRHNDIDFDAEQAAAVNSMKAVVEELFDVELDEADDAGSPEEIMAQVHEQMEREHRLRQEAHDARGQQKKTARQLARDAKLQAEAAETSLSIREVYRKLVSALHPDREPDLQERARKTVLMQRVNQAYERKDLLRLLELQLELEHIDAHSIAGLSEDRLRHFNKILKDQLAELEQEIAHVEMPLREQFNLPPYQPLAPHAVMPHLARDISALRRLVKQMQQELLVPNDPAAFKAWIKARKREAKAWEAGIGDDDGVPFA